MPPRDGEPRGRRRCVPSRRRAGCGGRRGQGRRRERERRAAARDRPPDGACLATGRMPGIPSPAAVGRARAGPCSVEVMDFGVAIFPTRRVARPGDARPAGRGARLRVAVLPRAHAHPGQPPDAVPAGRRAAARVLAHLRPARRAVVRRGGDDDAEARHRDHARRPARSDRDGEGGREPRRAERRAAAARRRRGLERGRDGGPRRRSARAASAACARGVEAMRALWTQDVASYEGEHISFAPSWSWPKPLQPGGPPVLRRRERQARAGARRRATATPGTRTSWATTTR